MREATPRRYLMCEPRYFEVVYEINPWMDPAVPVSRHLALQQWDKLRHTLERLGHEVELIEPIDGLPDMVFTANAALVIDGTSLLARMAHPQRQGEEAPIAAWFAAHGYTCLTPQATNEGEGDLRPTARGLLAAYGQRTEVAAHLEASDAFSAPIIPVQLVDPRFYHLDTALAVLDPETIVYYPPAFSAASAAKLAALFPGAIVASDDDAAHFGLNMISDGRHVILPPQVPALSTALRARGFTPIEVDVSELRRAGGGAKCCTLELRHG